MCQDEKLFQMIIPQKWGFLRDSHTGEEKQLRVRTGHRKRFQALLIIYQTKLKYESVTQIMMGERSHFDKEYSFLYILGSLFKF